jgi:endo-1,4-beta-mannosidase
MTETTETTTVDTAVDGSETANDVAMESQQQQTYDDGLDEFRHENGKIFGKFNDARSGLLAYKELQKEYTKAKQENKPAPENYVFELDEDVKDKFSIDENSKDYQTFVPLMKELNLSNEKANKLINEYARMKIAEQEGVDFEAEMDKIGGINGPVVQGLVTFAKKNLDQEGIDWLSDKVRTAEDAEYMNNLIKKARGANVSIPETSIETPADMQKTARDYADEAFNYQKEHARTIGYTPEQQQHYMRLMELAASKK